MEAPKCPLCGERHWRPPCPGVQTNKPSRKPTTRPVEKTAAHSSASERIAKPPKPAFDRVAYQRAYMRNYRRCRGHRPFVDALTMQELEKELDDILRIESIELFPWHQEVLRRCQALDGSVSFPNLPHALAPRPQYRARQKARE